MMGVVAQLEEQDRANRLGRSDRSALGRWFWEIDRVLLLLRRGADRDRPDRRRRRLARRRPALFGRRGQLRAALLFLPPAGLDRRRPAGDDRRLDAAAGPRRDALCLVGALVFTVLLFLVPIIGVEVNGARRWLGVGFAQFQPSEFLKPLFIVSIAWLLSLKEQDASLPVVPLSGICTGLIALLLMQQPNFGETIIFAAAWVLLLTLSGRLAADARPARRWPALVGIVLAYFFYPVATARIDAFLFAGGGHDTYQTDSALRTLTAGGLFGAGPGRRHRASSSCPSRTPTTSSR